MQKRTMEGDKPPVTIQELIQLQAIGIPADHVTWARVSMSSDCHICICTRRKAADQSRRNDHQVVVLDLKNEGCPQVSLAFKAEAAMVSPPDPCGKLPFRVAIRGGNLLLVQRLSDSNSNLGSDAQFTCRVPDMQFWTWLTADTLALVTDHSVYHWALREGCGPEKIFSRHQRLEYSEIISYKGCSSGKWYALTGLLPQEDCIAGVTQLFSVSQSIAQCIAAHVVTFSEYQFDGNQQPSTILCVASRDPDSNAGKVHVIELGPHIEGNLAPSSHSDIFKLTDEEDRYDFPVALQVAPKYRLLYIFTKYGQLYLCDIETATILVSTTISTSIVFSTALSTATQGVLAVCRKGQVLSIDVKSDHLTHHIRHTLGKPLLADKLQRLLPPKSKTKAVTRSKSLLATKVTTPKPKTRAMQMLHNTNCHAT